MNMVKAGESKVPDVYHMEQDSALGFSRSTVEFFFKVFFFLTSNSIQCFIEFHASYMLQHPRILLAF